MNLQLKSFQGFFTLAGAGIISQLIALLTWRYLGQLLTLESIGEFTLNIFWIELICIFGLMGAETFYPKYIYDIKFNKTTFNFSRDIAILSLLFTIGFLVINHVLDLWSIPNNPFFLIIAGTVVAITNFRFNQSVRLVEKNLIFYAVYQVARPTVFIFTILILLKLNSAPDLYISYLISFACLSLVSIFLNYRPREFVQRGRSILWIRHSYHFAAVGIFGIISTYSSRLLTNQIFTVSQVGLLALLLSFSAPIKSLVSVFDKVYYPMAIKSLNRTGNLGLGNYSIYIFGVALIFLTGFKIFMPTIGAFFAVTGEGDLRTLRYLYYSFLPMLIWILFVPIIIQNIPRRYATLKAITVLLVVIFQAVIFRWISFGDIGIAIYISECLYLIPMFIMIGPYVSSGEKISFIFYCVLCLIPFILN